MLTYFPTPYPGEWWYSVLCRYHVRSGRTKHQTTVMELFGRERVPLSSVFPNMEQLGITASQLNILAQKYRIKPFWRRVGGEQTEQHKFSVILDDEEYLLYQIAKNASGFRFDRHFIKHCLIEYIKKSRGDSLN